jgi:Domain of unknown function (DUF4328)
LYCTQCRVHLSIDAVFCYSCGAPVHRPRTKTNVDVSEHVPPAVIAGSAGTESKSHTIQTSLCCPKCGLFSPASTVCCDCGYNFESKLVGPSAELRRHVNQMVNSGPFANVQGPARWTKSLLIATVVLCVISIVSGLMQVELLSRTAYGISEAEATTNDLREQVIGGLQLLFLLATAVTFLTWFYRAHSNLRALGAARLAYTPRWAVGGFFVPFLNLVRPFQVMRELWNVTMEPRSDMRAKADSSEEVQSPSSSLVNWWWGCFLVSGILGNMVMRLSFKQEPSVTDLMTATWLGVTSAVIDVAGAVLAILLVEKITKRQLETWKYFSSKRMQAI